MVVSHDTKRILGISSLVLILLLLLARGLPFPFPGSQPSASPRIRNAPSLIFSDNVSFNGPAPTFNLTLIQFHSYMWKFNVTADSVKIDLTDPKTGSIFWAVGPSSLGQWHLNGTGSVSFNWTAPASTYYSMVLENLNISPSPWSSSWFSSGSPYFSCDIHVWDLDTLKVHFL
jgi:hypothetical protein